MIYAWEKLRFMNSYKFWGVVTMIQVGEKLRFIRNANVYNLWEVIKRNYKKKRGGGFSAKIWLGK